MAAPIRSVSARRVALVSQLIARCAVLEKDDTAQEDADERVEAQGQADMENALREEKDTGEPTTTLARGLIGID